ncbi:MAG: 50S ribosomal protein L11 methyltransferase [Rhodomicrobium sp.]|jgi:ribosomal protein L11 methyltransferase
MASFKTVLGFRSEEDAAKAGALLGETPGLDDLPLVLREDGDRWFLEVYDCGVLAKDGADGLFEPLGVAVLSCAAEAIPDADWVSETQKALPPVRAGRFLVHGSHDRGEIASIWAIEIDAGRAFGTAHHGTTKGCLAAIGRLTAPARTVLDLGTGSGVLAIAAAKALSHRARIAAADLDPIAIEVARENCRKNGAACVRFFIGDGLKPASAYRAAPFDLVMANILAKPLLKLAPRLRTLTRLGGALILSGLLSGQAREVLARYRATGFRLVRRSDLEGWATLTLKRDA